MLRRNFLDQTEWAPGALLPVVSIVAVPIVLFIGEPIWIFLANVERAMNLTLARSVIFSNLKTHLSTPALNAD
jgi:hypothetical protein